MSSATIAVLTLTVSVALAGMLSWFMPGLTRRNLYFSVTVAPAFRDTPHARETLRRYRLEAGAVSFAFIALAIAIGRANPLLMPLALYAECFALFCVFFRARRSTLPYAVEPIAVREAALVDRPRIVPGGLPAAAVPFLVLAATAAYVWTHASELPARIPVHFDLQFRPDRWAPRTPATLLTPLLMAFLTLVLFAVVLYGLGHWVRAISAGGAAGSREARFRRIIAVIVLACSYALAVQFAFIALLPFNPTFHPGAGIGLVMAFVPVLIIVAGVVALARLKQGGGGEPVLAGAAPAGDRSADRYWRLGVFYVNPNDPALFVEKRFGLGYTLNFGHAASWLILLVPIALTALVPLILTHTSTLLER